MSLDLDAIKARAAAATQGPWKTSGAGYSVSLDDGSGFLVANTFLKGALGIADLHDAKFIAHARTDVPALVTEVELLRAQVAQYRQWVIDANAYAYKVTQL